MPLFLLGRDGTVRRVNSAAGAMLGSGPGYATGKLFTAFVDLPSRAAVRRSWPLRCARDETQVLQCRLLCRERPGRLHARRAPGQPPRRHGPADRHGRAARRGGRTGRAGRPAGPTAGRPARRPGGGAGDDSPARPGNRRHQDLAGERHLQRTGGPAAVRAAAVAGARRLGHHRRGAGPAAAAADGDRTENQQAEELARAVAAVDPQPDTAPLQVHESGSALLVAHAGTPACWATVPTASRC